MDVALYGGSFDPPHVAHVLTAVYALSTGGFDRVLVVPVFAHAFDKPLAPFEHRLEMTRLALGWLPGVEVSDVERLLGAPSRTLHTVERLLADDPRLRLRLVVGADVLLERDQWLGWDRLAALAPPFVLGRAGVEHPEAPPPLLPDVSSTRVRDLLRRCTAPRAGDAELERLLPRSVLRYVDEHGLYR